MIAASLHEADENNIGYVGELMARGRSAAPLAVLNVIDAVLVQFRVRNPAITATNMLAFIHVARDEDTGISQSELMKRFHVSDATVSRMIRALTKEGDGRSPGLGLVELRTDPADVRRKNIVLTADGKRLRDAVIDALVMPPKPA